MFCLAASCAQASYHTFALDEIYSSADGAVQYLVLRETQGANDQNLLSGHALTVNPAGVGKTYTFDHDLPQGATAGKRVLIATPAFAALRIVTPDYLIPSRFVPTDGGTLDYAGVDRWAYPALPTDGASALFRNGTSAPNLATNFAGQAAAAPALPITVVEYFNAGLEHYFVTGLAPDIDALDSGRTAGWSRTGQSFKAFPSQASGGAGVNPACRFYIPPQHGDSHFFSASPAECAMVLEKTQTDPNYSGYAYESPNVFYVALPDPITGACPTGTAAVYRLWNGRADSNHRYTTDLAIKAQMLTLGYFAEGYGPDSVSLCGTTVAAATSEVRVTGSTPFALGCDGVAPTGTLYAGAEVEPFIAVDPRDPNHLIGAWQQDRWSNGGARGLVNGVSFDGGANWSRQTAPFSRCTGGNAANDGDYARVSDPWVSFAPDGIAWQIGLSFTGGTFQPRSENAVLVSHSADGGLTWSDPTTLIHDGSDRFNDKESLTADPVDARYVYAVWDRLDPANNGPSYFSRTTNGGLTWEAPRPIYDPGVRHQTINNQIVVLPDGMLVDFFTQLDTANDGTVSARLRLIRSADKGDTWSLPITIAAAQALGTHDPETLRPIRDGVILGAIAVGLQGELAVTWQDARFSGGVRDGVALSRSFDGGLGWSVPVQVNHDSTAQAFVPSVAILANGTIGVTYYDLRSNTSDPTTLPTDYWLAVSTDGTTWRENQLAGPFDLAIAPRSATTASGAALFLGDYQGLTSGGNRFISLFARTNDDDTANRTDIVATVVGIASGAAQHAPRQTNEQRAARLPVAPLALTPELRRRLSDTIVRSMRRRVPGWTPWGVDPNTAEHTE